MYITLSVILTWLWSSNPILSGYNLQLTGALTLLYFGLKFFSRSVNQKSISFPSTIILNTICLLLVFSTGGITSPLFFLLDLLFFALALLFEPIQAVVASLLIVAIFISQHYSSMNTDKIINLFSLILMTPIAVIFSRNYLEVLEDKGKIKVLQAALEETETESLLWISKQAKPSMASVLNATTDLVMYFNSKGRELFIPPAIVEKLRAIQTDMITLYSSASMLEKSIETESDKNRL
ncbi:TPA: hypothetical protein DIU27_05300 [Candidatus Collierbacteria bacterium]|uniref:Uncharacterized protein n=1 Tax=Candidatus Collierbacteria bacterium GW2011_GWB2_44_22 TaxID=1618387 RepID=A0A0G1KVF1_9BACT|nr:MAG: hypothetical protein UW31_C0002G0031 [Candidatus Collierbacteria bacterium GW2011_GWA2_44_13]KKT51889.1 MAG: hypothetical protein UW44_C0006G0007 [Candidatus Collierbacteria bacterium GW2011_GWB2_44_22]KKT62199.1 MAG: hypothetical protein UW56_C0010G0031 [Candidatus Collierbacteria bacterium GW2011_GWD1_44_27]KKT66188.1 MAG: hypothetical protein UW58_C0012G0030 [Candidatus Collierbacteria bacterium GW2011_GWC2_44_30]KKT68817.1 MAG: hypothetical protein UW64_C0009G0029 [Microgenomates gr